MQTSGRWLPDGMRVERAGSGGVRLRGGRHDGREFETVELLVQFVRREYPGLGPDRQRPSR